LLVWAAIGLGLRVGGGFVWSGVAVLFVIVPALEWLLGRSPAQAPRPRSLAADLPLWAVLPVQILLTALALDLAADTSRGAVERIGGMISCGVVSGAVGIVAAHELIHRKSAAERALGELLMALVNWPLYPIEHVYGHHRTVGTPADPATAPRGMGFWSFLPHVMTGEVRSAWRLEGERLRRRGLRAGSWSDRRMRGILTMTALNAAVFAAWGPAGWLGYLTSGLVAVTLLQAVQYVEHYGLVRAALPEGGFAPQTAAHSWDSEYSASKAILFQLPRHADHHLLASRPYPELAGHPESPQLPGGYAQMILLALLPPLWHRAMDRRLPHAGGGAA
jgi:alkane 1-monooxygenase